MIHHQEGLCPASGCVGGRLVGAAPSTNQSAMLCTGLAGKATCLIPLLHAGVAGPGRQIPPNFDLPLVFIDCCKPLLAQTAGGACSCLSVCSNHAAALHQHWCGAEWLLAWGWGGVWGPYRCCKDVEIHSRYCRGGAGESMPMVDQLFRQHCSQGSSLLQAADVPRTAVHREGCLPKVNGFVNSEFASAAP